ncbi:hypothetical protein GQ600_9649 [Phytophthora cactorum]|nr:hypothetical protein GQ600_9649 [Phytophthora cactorum]
MGRCFRENLSREHLLAVEFRVRNTGDNHGDNIAKRVSSPLQRGTRRRLPAREQFAKQAHSFERVDAV